MTALAIVTQVSGSTPAYQNLEISSVLVTMPLHDREVTLEDPRIFVAILPQLLRIVELVATIFHLFTPKVALLELVSQLALVIASFVESIGCSMSTSSKAIPSRRKYSNGGFPSQYVQ